MIRLATRSAAIVYVTVLLPSCGRVGYDSLLWIDATDAAVADSGLVAIDGGSVDSTVDEAIVPGDGGGGAVGDAGSSLNCQNALPLRATSITTSTTHTCAVQPGGDAYCWGRNDHGELGTGDEQGRLLPSRVDGAEVWRQVTVGSAVTCGITIQGNLWCWGSNTEGRLGAGGGPDRHTPQQVGTDSDWINVTAAHHLCATKSNGTLWCWGRGNEGQPRQWTHW